MSTKFIREKSLVEHNFGSFLTSKRKQIFALGVCCVLTLSLLWKFSSTVGASVKLFNNFIVQTIDNLGVDESLDFNRFYNMTVSFEGDQKCNLANNTSCFVTDKSLVIAFCSHVSREKWLAQNFLRVFDNQHFTRIIMVHDSSDWSSYPNKEQFIWIHVHAQKPFWYLKRFITPILAKTYKYIWVLNDDVELLFDPLHYECVISRLAIPLSAPGRMKGIVSHGITRVHANYINRTGRWTDFVEIGPIFVVNSSTWHCIWQFLSSFVGMGWGLDLVWCPLLIQRCSSANPKRNQSCAVLDAFEVNHLSDRIGSAALGIREIPAYNQYYSKFYTTKSTIFNPLAKDRSIFLDCNKTR